MTSKITNIVVSAVLVGGFLIASTAASAGGGDRRSHHRSGSYSHYNYNNHYYGGSHYGGGYVGYSSYGYGGSYYGYPSYSFSYGGHLGHSGAGNVLLGLGVGMLLYEATRPKRNSTANYDYQTLGNQGAYRNVSENYTPVRSSNSGQSARSGLENTSCLQTREYQTTITIGGEEKEAYGTACLQPDGSWIAGAPNLVPDY